jgi:hypothetical protein
VQTLFRLPRSNGILFGVRCYLISLEELSRVRKWRNRLARVLRTLDPALVEYKGLGRYRELAVAYLGAQDDGLPLPSGTHPDQTAL